MQTALSSNFPCSVIEPNPQNLKTELKTERTSKDLYSTQDPTEGNSKEHGGHPLDHYGSDHKSHQLIPSSSPDQFSQVWSFGWLSIKKFLILFWTFKPQTTFQTSLSIPCASKSETSISWESNLYPDFTE